MSKLLSGLEGIVVCQMDDILIFGKTKEEHDIRLMKALDSLNRSHSQQGEVPVWSRRH